MTSFVHKLTITGAGILWTLTACLSAKAEDVEIFVGDLPPGDRVNPNILFILDDSGSMGAEVVTQNAYDPSVVYDGACDDGRVYWSTSGTPPSCSTDWYFDRSAFFCQRALDAFGAHQGGSYQGLMAQYDTAGQDRWEQISPSEKSSPVECEADLPDPSVGWSGHGGGSNAAAVYPQNGDGRQLWTADESASARVTWGSWPAHQRYTVYSGNYLNWYYGPATATTRMQVMKDAANGLINATDGVNVGLMHFNNDEGGEVLHAMADVAAARSSMQTAINGLAAGGFTPVSETLYEAYLYFRGGLVDYGTGSVAESRDPTNGERYNSPIDASCQKSHIVILTDGEPRLDSGADDKILGLVDAAGQSFSSLVGASCDAETYPPGVAGDGGDCLDDLAEFMHKGDLSPLPGVQNVTTHTIGFLVDLPILADTAARGGGQYRTAADSASLMTALTNIVGEVSSTQATFTAPAISINAFTQTRHSDDVYVALFQPSSTAHWPGNLKKFRLSASGSRIVDANGLPVIDPATGIFAETVQDLWSSTIDGADVTAGGAANRIPAARKVYTYFGNESLTHASNSIDAGNALLTDDVLNTGTQDRPTRQNVIDFINGIDVSDADQDGNSVEPRHQLGDPLHSRPVVVAYGPDDALVFVGTNDGFLHAFNADDGSEAWAFLPPEFLGGQADLLIDGPAMSKTYGVDGSIHVQTIADGNGVIEPADGERVLLFFGMRRGGDAYYALDVTDPDAPEVLWRKDSNDLPGLGQSWSSATPTRIDMQGVSQNEHKLVLVIGGGYDPSQDAEAPSTDAAGNSIYILDTLSGSLLWHGTNSGGDADFSTSSWSMDYSIPADVRVIDLNGDGFADRMYAADMGGQIWRFDVHNGEPPASLVTGGVIAQLGAAGRLQPTIEETRRFYYAPDIAVVVNEDFNFIHIGIGSGHRPHPNTAVNHDEFYALRDYSTFAPRTQAQYEALTPVVPSDLVLVSNELETSVPQGSPGWRLSLNDGGWLGEKVLAEARTFDGNVYISTYRPAASNSGCGPALGIIRQYIVSLFNAAPVNNLDGSVDDYNGDGIVDPSDLQLTDRYREYHGPPPPETIFFFPRPASDGQGDGDGIEGGLTLACVDGENCLGETSCLGLRCFESETERYPVRTFWSQDSVE